MAFFFSSYRRRLMDCRLSKILGCVCVCDRKLNLNYCRTPSSLQLTLSIAFNRRGESRFNHGMNVFQRSNCIDDGRYGMTTNRCPRLPYDGPTSSTLSFLFFPVRVLHLPESRRRTDKRSKLMPCRPMFTASLSRLSGERTYL
jgi:hypothetical protein